MNRKSNRKNSRKRSKKKNNLLLPCVILIIAVFCVLSSINRAPERESAPTVSGNVLEMDGKMGEKEENNDTENETLSTEMKETNNEEKIDIVGNIVATSNVTSSSNPKEYTTKYYIKVNYEQNVVTIYEKDNDGKYTVPVKAMVCSTGTETPTSGVYTIKYRWEWLGLFNDVYGHYVTQITGNILFHSVPYTAKSPDTLEYWEYDKLGTAASLGCVRLKAVDAKWIYDNVVWGTPVEFYASSDPGPLGKPTAQKISDNVDCRNWDPTDTDSLNPWNKPKEETKVEEEPEEKEEPKENMPSEGNVNIYTEFATP